MHFKEIFNNKHFNNFRYARLTIKKKYNNRTFFATN